MLDGIILSELPFLNEGSNPFTFQYENADRNTCLTFPPIDLFVSFFHVLRSQKKRRITH